MYEYLPDGHGSPARTVQVLRGSVLLDDIKAKVKRYEVIESGLEAEIGQAVINNIPKKDLEALRVKLIWCGGAIDVMVELLDAKY